MKSLITLICLALTVTLFGCGSGNSSACNAYVDHYNTLECLPDGAQIDIDQQCGLLDQAPCDVASYFTCLTENTTCTDGNLDISGQLQCNDLLESLLDSCT